MECEHLIDGTCAVATKLAGVTVPADQRNCEVCLGCDSPKAENVATIGLARVTLRKMGLPSDHLYPESLRDGLELTKDAQTGPLLLVDGMGRAFMRELPWVEAHQSGCDCFSYLRLMNNWGAGRCVSERSRIVGWFMGVAKQLQIEVAPSEVELAIFRAAEIIRHRDEDAVASWPFLFTYYAAGAVGDELKYSIRSVLHHQPGARVIVIGDKPISTPFGIVIASCCLRPSSCHASSGTWMTFTGSSRSRWLRRRSPNTCVMFPRHGSKRGIPTTLGARRGPMPTAGCWITTGRPTTSRPICRSRFNRANS